MRRSLLRSDPVPHPLPFVFAMLASLLLPSLAWAEPSVCPGWEEVPQPERPAHEIFVSPYTYHWTPSDEHKPVGAITLSRLLPDNRFCGLSFFRNSFGQPSAYAFTGWTLPGLFKSIPQSYGSLTAGIIYGYVGQYKDKVPLNFGGFAPVLIPAVGYRLSPEMSVEIQILGAAAVMFGTTLRF